MLILNPTSVSFGGTEWPDVRFIAVERSTSRLVLERSDAGPHVVLADAAEETVTLRVGQHLADHAEPPLRCGDQAELAFFTSPSAGSARRERIRTVAVVTEVKYDFTPDRSAVRTIRLVAISPDGNSDPIATEPAD
ncbi:MAG: hypothetical protein AMXMBFR58_28360 [Phycisphaerae bacterium]|nr:hypothetical protein [Phycisphaerales bacterium]